MELSSIPKNSQPEPRVNDLLKECRQWATTNDELTLFLRIHYLYEPDQTEVISKSLAYLAQCADFQSLAKLLTALQTIKFPLKSDQLFAVILAALTQLKKELQKNTTEVLDSYYLLQDILPTVTSEERQLPGWQKVTAVAGEVLWMAIQKPHFPSFYTLRQLISPALLLKTLSLQLQHVDQPQAMIHSMLSALMTTPVREMLTKDEQAMRLVQAILNKALLFRNRAVISTFLPDKRLIPPEYLVTAQKYQRKAALTAEDPIHLIVEDLDQINKEIKSTPTHHSFKSIAQREAAIVCQLYRWARQGNWPSYAELRSRIFEFNDQCQHQVNIVKPMDLQDNILTVLIKGYFADTKAKKPWLKEIANFITVDTLGYLADDEPIAGNPFSAALPYVLEHSVDEEADLGLITLLAKHVFHPGEDRHHQNFWHIAVRNKHLGRQTLNILYTNTALRAHIREPLPSSKQCRDVLYEAISQLDKEKISFFLNPPLAMSLSKCHMELLLNLQSRYRDYSAEGIRLAGIVDSLRPNLLFGHGREHVVPAWMPGSRRHGRESFAPLQTRTRHPCWDDTKMNEHIHAAWFGIQRVDSNYFVMKNKQRIENKSKENEIIQRLTGRNECINKHWDRLIFQKTTAIIQTVMTCLQDKLAKKPIIDCESKTKLPIFIQYTDLEIKQIFQAFTAGFANTLLRRELSKTELQVVRQHWAIISAEKIITFVLPRFRRDYLSDCPEYLILREGLFPIFGNQSTDFFDYACKRVFALTVGAQWDLPLHKYVSVAGLAEKLSDEISLQRLSTALLTSLPPAEEEEDSLEEIALNALVKRLPDGDSLYSYFYECLNIETLLVDCQAKYEFVFQYHSGTTLSRQGCRAPDHKNVKASHPYIRDLGIPAGTTCSNLPFFSASHPPEKKDQTITAVQRIIESKRRALFIEDFSSQFQIDVLPKCLKKGSTVSVKKLRDYFAHFFSASYLDQATVLSFSQHFKSLFWNYPNDTCHCLAQFLTEQLAPALSDALGFSANNYVENKVLAALRSQGFLAEHRLVNHRVKIQKILSKLLYDSLFPFIQTQHLHAKVPDPSLDGHFLLAMKRYIQQQLPPEKLASPLNDALSSTRIWRESKTMGYQSDEKNRPFTYGMGSQEWAMRCQLMQQRCQHSSLLDNLAKSVTMAWGTLSEQLKEQLMKENLQTGLSKQMSEAFSLNLAKQLLTLWQTVSLSVIDDTFNMETAMNAAIEHGEELIKGKLSPELVKAVWQEIRKGPQWHTLTKSQYHRIGVATITDWLNPILVGNQQTPARINMAVLSYYVRSKPDLLLRLEVARACHLNQIPANADTLIANCLLKTLAHTNHVTPEVSSRTISTHAHPIR